MKFPQIEGMPFRHYILKGKEIVPVDSVLEWGVFFDDIKNRRVGRDKIGRFDISTVFLGMDHGGINADLVDFTPDGKMHFNKEKYIPILFETMIFKGNDCGDLYTVRYATWDEAERNHKKLTAKIKKLLRYKGMRATLKLLEKL